MTDRVTKTLLLPGDAPCTLQTDVVDISIRCQVDITVLENDSYNNLRLDVPCHVVHNLDQDDCFYQDEETNIPPLEEFFFGKEAVAANHRKKDFQTADILPDLKLLAFSMHQSIHKAKN